jgi:hypothetical protein
MKRGKLYSSVIIDDENVNNVVVGVTKLSLEKRA